MPTPSPHLQLLAGLSPKQRQEAIYQNYRRLLIRHRYKNGARPMELVNEFEASVSEIYQVLNDMLAPADAAALLVKIQTTH